MNNTDDLTAQSNVVLPETSNQSPPRRAIDIVDASLKRRYAAERRFRLFGLSAVILGLSCVVVLFTSIIGQGYTAFQQTYIELPVTFDVAMIDPNGRLKQSGLTSSDINTILADVNFLKIARQALEKTFPYVEARHQKRLLYSLLSSNATQFLRDKVAANPTIIGTTQTLKLLADDDVDMFMKGRSTSINTLMTHGQATVIQSNQRAQIISTGEDFVIIRKQVKTFLTTSAQQQERAITRIQTALLDIEAERTARHQAQQNALAAGQAEQAERLIANDAELLARHTRLSRDLLAAQTKAADFRARAEATHGNELLNSNMPSYFVNINGGLVKVTEVKNNTISGEIFAPFNSKVAATGGEWNIIEFAQPEADRRLKDNQVAWIWQLKQQEMIAKYFNTLFFINSASREPEQAGIAGALMGSMYTLLLTMLFSFPIGVGAALYLEEFAPKNRWTDFIEVNINNLAAVPSVVFGLLGLAVFINFFGIPRSTPLVAAMVLTLMTLPIIIIAGRAALKSVPPSIREAALGIGASPLQTQLHHVLPLAMPGILTGSILGMAHALGETAPLLMIGMIAFIVDIPGGITDPATVLPVQIFLWADSPERGFVERTSAAILVLLLFLFLMNLTAVLLRRRFERRW
ncbi:phosphate ABC transporter permease PstA [Thiospirillum jenense]|uniref:Phosphate transport system permease protein PstA n=1 Tax=Thiospirillum jenense TaxID=1653858 RepID=A0A839HJM5_9GAMM|nr:phosphate ABC transporter permease PstA [Thiospirillum jenense]